MQMDGTGSGLYLEADFNGLILAVLRLRFLEPKC
jgi:hypothetical protein